MIHFKSSSPERNFQIFHLEWLCFKKNLINILILIWCIFKVSGNQNIYDFVGGRKCFWFPFPPIMAENVIRIDFITKFQDLLVYNQARNLLATLRCAHWGCCWHQKVWQHIKISKKSKFPGNCIFFPGTEKQIWLSVTVWGQVLHYLGVSFHFRLLQYLCFSLPKICSPILPFPVVRLLPFANPLKADT